MYHHKQVQYRAMIKTTILLLVAGMAVVAGCVERKETIRIAPNGAVSIDLKYSASPGDLETPVAFPSQESGWTVDRKSEFDKDGKETIILTSHRDFAPRETLPQNFAPAGDKDAPLHLQFPTTIRVEQRPDGAYMHFNRVYQPRQWAYVQYWHDLIFDDDVQKLGEKKLDELSMEEKARVVKAFAGFELYKQMELAKIAIAKMGDRISQDARLRARAILVDEYEDTDWKAFVSQFEPATKPATARPAEDAKDGSPSFKEQVRSAAHEAVEDKEQREAQFENAAKNLLDDVREDALAELKQAAKLNDKEVARLRLEFARAKKQYDISDALGSHAFKIKVVMPGEVVGHNGEKIDEDDGGVVWEFDGKAFRDRPFELAVTSKLPR